MPNTLLAVLLVTSSANGSNMVYRWPPSPTSSTRLARPKPGNTIAAQIDNPWRAALFSESDPEFNSKTTEHAVESDEEYEWPRPNTLRSRSMSFSRSHSASRGASPVKEGEHDLEEFDDSAPKNEYDGVFGFTGEFLAGMLCPHRAMCNQKFELTVDDLAFIGHPVCADEDGVWRFKQERTRHGARGRGERSERLAQVDESTPETSGSREREDGSGPRSAWLRTFHFVVVIDRPDPSSAAAGNVSKYYDIVYEQIAFTVTAVLFQEQVLSNWVEAECDALGALKESCISKGETFSAYNEQALKDSSIAAAMKSLFDALKTSSMAYVSLHGLPLELQLPPFLDLLLQSEDDVEAEFAGAGFGALSDDGVDDQSWGQSWGQALGYGWRLPVLAPWKSLLLFDRKDKNGDDPYLNLRGSHVNPEDRSLAHGLARFMDTVSVTLRLVDVASLLDWDLESQVFPIVRWLVLHRRAKVVDAVHPGLKTVFTLPPTFPSTLSQLSAEFKQEFPHPSIPPLAEILSAISTSTAKQSDTHFFAAVVGTKDRIAVYHDVLIWMLRRSLLVTLHLCIRVVATAPLKARVFEAQRARRGRKSKAPTQTREEAVAQAGDSPEDVHWLSMSPLSARRLSRQQDETAVPAVHEEDEAREASDEGDDDVRGSDREASMIGEPGKATPLQRRWLAAMSEGKDAAVARRFDLINQYFDGQKTDDEILFRADITRKQLREVLHHYEEYLQTFLHPS